MRILNTSPPTDPFTSLELQKSSDKVPDLHKIRRSPDLEACKLYKGRSGPFSFVNGFDNELLKPMTPAS